MKKCEIAEEVKEIKDETVRVLKVLLEEGISGEEAWKTLAYVSVCHSRALSFILNAEPKELSEAHILSRKIYEEMSK